MSRFLCFVLFLSAGMYFSVAAVGGSTSAPFLTLVCGYLAGVYAAQPGARCDG